MQVVVSAVPATRLLLASTRVQACFGFRTQWFHTESAVMYLAVGFRVGGGVGNAKRLQRPGNRPNT